MDAQHKETEIMNALPAPHTEGHVARPLKVLVPLIKEDLRLGNEAAQEAAMPFYIAAGDKMLEARPQVGHGNFGSWLKRNFSISHTQAYRWMAAAEAKQKFQGRNFSSINDALKESGHHGYMPNKPRPQPWHEPVKQTIEQARREAERIRDAELTRQQERDAERKLALRLIDIGYKVLAKELHPDKGGSRDAMTRLAVVRDRLKAHA
jgi:hypothetical protein